MAVNYHATDVAQNVHQTTNREAEPLCERLCPPSSLRSARTSTPYSLPDHFVFAAIGSPETLKGDVITGASTSDRVSNAATLNARAEVMHANHHPFAVSELRRVVVNTSPVSVFCCMGESSHSLPF